MDTLQFYPTPRALADKVWRMFDDQMFCRILEPSAGRGHLLDALKERDFGRYYPQGKVDVCEINLEHHAALREKGYNVVDVDFFNHQTVVGYSHIAMNPPFAHGVDHVLHAWNLLKDGELVAILNAETVKNPCNKKRELLVKLIEDHGEVEFVQSAFEDPDTLRRTAVEVALVHLIKRQQIELPDLTVGLNEDDFKADSINRPQELALPNSTIKNTVRAFDAAVKAMQNAVIATATENYYESLITLKKPADVPGNADPAATSCEPPKIDFSRVQNVINERYDKLKENAWRTVINSTEFSNRFTSKVRHDIEKQIDGLTKMQFTVNNVYAVLEGLIASKTDLDIQAVVEVFDKITAYHTGNRIYYRGWVSNDRHRLGWKVHAKRFILPNMKNTWSGGVSWDAERELADIDRAFALLDGKQDPENGMVQAIKHDEYAVLAAQRVTSDYFEIRFYKGTGTIHFFPTRPDLIERMNRIVGQHRNWLPDPAEKVPEAFWMQYDQADKVTHKLHQVIENHPESRWKKHREEFIEELYDEACETAGIPVWNGLAHEGDNMQLPLLEDDAA